MWASYGVTLGTEHKTVFLGNKVQPYFPAYLGLWVDCLQLLITIRSLWNSESICKVEGQGR